MYLRDFKVIRPNFEADQESLLEWIAKAHAKSWTTWNANNTESKQFTTELRDELLRLGLGKNKIQKRGYHLDDCNHENWDQMRIYNINSEPEGSLLSKRMDFFSEASAEIFERMYEDNAQLPPHLIHVTCTGYVAPSAAQKLVSARSSGKSTTVTHAYHMGCYGSIPSIRIGMGHYLVEKEQTDIVHTEFCSLHMNPSIHTTEQLVIDSLFADGFIKYTVGDKVASPALKILSVIEQVIDNSTSKMTWDCNHWGFQMSIAKDVPALIRMNLKEYLKRLAKKGGIELEALMKARYAIHPGGPKIVEQIADKLKLSPEQISHSQFILQNYGNMSSATLPHVFDQMLKDESIPEGELIVGLAFGPGLSISGGLFEKR